MIKIGNIYKQKNMKKLFSTMLAAVTAIAALATDYTGTLTVTVNGNATTQDGVSININKNADNTYNLTLNNFVLLNEETTIPVGNINLSNIDGAAQGNITALYVDKDVTIEEGTDPNMSFWMGPMLGPVPLKMIARFTDDYLAVDIDIDMQETLQQTINVKFDNTGKHFQLPNGDFEEWSSNTDITEPRYWHGFKSATGSLASQASSTLLKSEDVRPGATGFSAVVASKSVLGIAIANGTITNGQLNAQHMTADNTWNHSMMEEASTATDKYGDKFYMPLNAKPDAIKSWIKFSQETPNNNYPYATFSAVAFNGEYYQDPEPKPGDKSALWGGTTYTQDDANNVAARVAAKAQDKNIVVTDWRELILPFDYTGHTADARAILITVSTNATPGQGNANDQVFIDDIELIYYANVTDIKYQGTTINGFDPAVKTYDMGETDVMPAVSDLAATVEGASATTAYQVIETQTGYQAIVYAISGDLQTANVYVLNFNKPATPLAQIIESGVNGKEYIVGNELAIADDFEIVNGDTKKVGATDNLGNYVALIVPADFNGHTVTFRDLVGTYTVENGNPIITATYIKEFTGEQISYEPETLDLSRIAGVGINVMPSQVIYLQGYGDADGKLRSYRNYPQGTSIVLNNLSGITIQPGNLYKMYGMMTLNEAWETTPQGIMPKIAPTDSNYFDNYTFVAVSGEETIITAIDNINTAGRQVEAIYNAQGQRVNENATGILIIRYTDGTVTKIVR